MRARWRAALGVAAFAAALPVLSACRRSGPDVVAQAEEAADSADQFMTRMTVVLTSQGVRQANVEADSAFVYDNAGRTELRRVHVTFFSVTGVQQSVLTSDSGTYNTRAETMEARGHVVVVRSDGARLTTSLLRYNQNSNQVSTDQPYTYEEGDRRVRGEGFVSDPSFSNITTQAVRGTGGRFTLPGQ